MTGTEYQNLAMRTSNGLHTLNEGLANGALGLCGEAGEASELVKKFLFHGKPLDIEKLRYELGDVLWYVALLCNLTGLSLDDVMQGNVDKLKARYPSGFPSIED